TAKAQLEAVRPRRDQRGDVFGRASVEQRQHDVRHQNQNDETAHDPEQAREEVSDPAPRSADRCATRAHARSLPRLPPSVQGPSPVIPPLLGTAALPPSGRRLRTGGWRQLRGPRGTRPSASLPRRGLVTTRPPPRGPRAQPPGRSPP